MQDIINDIIDSKCSIIILTEDEYPTHLAETIRWLKIAGLKICYVSLSNPYKKVLEYFEKKGIDPYNIFFIDVMTDTSIETERNCTFLHSTDIELLKREIHNCIMNRNCSTIIFDTISAFLMYENKSSIVKLTNDILSKKEYFNINNIYLILKDQETKKDDNNDLLKDLTMFADRTIDLS